MVITCLLRQKCSVFLCLRILNLPQAANVVTKIDDLFGRGGPLVVVNDSWMVSDVIVIHPQ